MRGGRERGGGRKGERMEGEGGIITDSKFPYLVH